MTAGEKIREIRTAKKMTLAEVEGRAGLTDGNLSRIERGKQWVSEEVLRSIADAMMVRVADFFDDAARDISVNDYAHPATQQMKEMLEQARDEVRLLAVYRLAGPDDRAVIDAAIQDAIQNLDVISVFNKRQ